VYATFGQELYARETVRAAELIAANGGGGLAARIADHLPHPSPSTRERLATKLLQRLAAGSGDAEGREAFARLIAGLRDSEARRELIYYAVTRVDGLVGAIAREVLYPYFIDGQLPRGVAEADFVIHNTGRLLTVEPVLTLPFVAWYAAKQWDFLSARTVALAMRILRQAGILLAAPLTGGPRRTLAYTLAPHSLTRPALVWCLYDEFAAAPSIPTVDRIEHSAFARTFVVLPSVITARLRDAEREGFVRYTTSAGARRVVLPLSREEVIAGLLTAEGVTG